MFEPGCERASAPHKLRMVWIARTGEEDDGRVGEATGEEGGERGRGAVVWAALGVGGVGGVGVGKEVCGGVRRGVERGVGRGSIQ